MIARIIIPLVLIIVLVDLHYDFHWLRRWCRRRLWLRLHWWLPAAVLIVWGVWLSLSQGFIPDNISIVNGYLFCLGMVVLPKAVVALCLMLGQAVRKFTSCRWRWDRWLAAACCIFVWYAIIYGSTAGISSLEVRHVDLSFDNLPEKYDGYRIVHFSDAHLGSFNDWRRSLLTADIDSINAQHPDLIIFTGDVQNTKPAELTDFSREMSRLRAADGVISVLGNHDYSYYTREDSLTEARWRQLTIDLQRQWGWRVLRNEHATLRRGQDSLVVMGEENMKNPNLADYAKASEGIGAEAFVIFLQHNPKGWRERVVGDTRCALSLSGHTHGGQVSLFGFDLTGLAYRENRGLYQEGSQWLNVSAGIGALIPFRFGIPPEITVINLHKRKS